MEEIYSRMLVSDGCAEMNGGGFSDIVLYSRVSCLFVSSLIPRCDVPD